MRQSIAYQRAENDTGYYLFTVDYETVKQAMDHGIYFKVDHRKQRFVAFVTELPKIAKFNFSEWEVKIPTERQLEQMEKLLSYKRILEKNVAKIQNELERLDQKISNDTKKYGLKLKLGSPDDSQIYAGNKTRLHHQQYLSEIINEDLVKKIYKKYKLRGIFEKHVVYHLDKEALKKQLKKLPDNLVAEILSYTVRHRLREIHLKNPECLYCGGKKAKRTKECKNCCQVEQTANNKKSSAKAA